LIAEIRRRRWDEGGKEGNRGRLAREKNRWRRRRRGRDPSLGHSHLVQLEKGKLTR